MSRETQSLLRWSWINFLDGRSCPWLKPVAPVPKPWVVMAWCKCHPTTRSFKTCTPCPWTRPLHTTPPVYPTFPCFWAWIRAAPLMWRKCWIRRKGITRSLRRRIKRSGLFLGSLISDLISVKHAVVAGPIITLILGMEVDQVAWLVESPSNNNVHEDVMTLPWPWMLLLLNWCPVFLKSFNTICWTKVWHLIPRVSASWTVPVTIWPCCRAC